MHYCKYSIYSNAFRKIQQKRINYEIDASDPQNVDSENMSDQIWGSSCFSSLALVGTCLIGKKDD